MPRHRAQAEEEEQVTTPDCPVCLKPSVPAKPDQGYSADWDVDWYCPECSIVFNDEGEILVQPE